MDHSSNATKTNFLRRLLATKFNIGSLIRFENDAIHRLQVHQRLAKEGADDRVRSLAEKFEVQSREEIKIIRSLIDYQKETIDDEQKSTNRIRILHFDDQPDSKAKQITILPSTTNLRRHFLSAVFVNLDLESDGHLKKFLTLQNELHEGIGEKRTLATIGTHDWNSIKGNLIYDARDPNQIALVPLEKALKSVSAHDFYEQLCREAEQQRKSKTPNHISGLSNYLNLLENQPEFVFLADEDRQVISLPPLTNAERTKLSPKSRTVFVEITSNYSMEICHRMMEMFIEEIFRHELVEKDPQGQQILLMEQTRTIDQNGQLQVTFPSCTDLQFEQDKASATLNIQIEHLFPSD